MLRFRKPEGSNQADEINSKANRRGRIRELLGANAGSGVTASVAVTHANKVPISRPPMFAAKLSPVPRRWTG